MYCRWLGELEGLPEKQQVYPPLEVLYEIAEGRNAA